MGNPVIVTPTGGTSASAMGAVITATAQMVSLSPQQIIGFVPLTDCTFVECRTWRNDCYYNPVFGVTSAKTASYENDMNSFFILDPLRRTVKFRLFRLSNGVAVQVNSNMNSTYGTIKAYGSIPTNPNYTGIILNWGAVLALHGAGFYVVVLSTASSIPDNNNRQPFCKWSEPFKLLPFTCNLAHRTVKFESTNSGKLGSITEDGVVYDLCGFSYYDSIRVPGFFGEEKTSYNTTELEYQNGLIDLVSDEALQTFTFRSRLLPKWLHDRMKAYMGMADKTLVSDYNRNNADYNIKRKYIRVNGPWEPKWNGQNLLSSVEVQFKEGIESVYKSISCP